MEPPIRRQEPRSARRSNALAVILTLVALVVIWGIVLAPLFSNGQRPHPQDDISTVDQREAEADAQEVIIHAADTQDVSTP